MNKKDVKFLLPLISMLFTDVNSMAPSAMTTVVEKSVSNSTKLSALKADLFGKVAAGDAQAAQRMFEASEDLKTHIYDLFKVKAKDDTLLEAFLESQNVEVSYDFIEKSKNPTELGKLMGFLSIKGYREGAVELAGSGVSTKAKKNVIAFWNGFLEVYNKKDVKDILSNLESNGLDLHAKDAAKKGETKEETSESEKSESEESVSEEAAPLKITNGAYKKYNVVVSQEKDIKALGSYISKKYGSQWYLIGVKHKDIMIAPISKKVADNDTLETVKFVVNSANLAPAE